MKKKGFKLCPANPLIPRDSVVPVPLPGFFSFHLYVITSPHKYHLHGDGTLLTTTETLIIRCALTTVSHVSNVALGVLLLSGKKIHILTDIGLSDSHKMLYIPYFHGPQRVEPVDVGDPPTLPSPAGWILNLSNNKSHYLLDGLAHHLVQEFMLP